MTPDVKFYYDGKGLPSIPAYSKGKTTKVYTNVSATEYNSFDEFGRVKRSKQITDGVTYGDDTNPMTYTYNLSGALVEQKYPSGRVVKTTLDVNGDLAQVQSKKNANHGFFTYADAFAYNSAGAIKKMQLGNGKWETFKYNDRQQITQIGLGTTDTDVNPNLLKLEFSYGTSTQNNGSMLEQKVTVPPVGSNPGFTAIQTYTYDSLNRIQSARETVGGTQTWKQTFIIDRYGNREYDSNPANTTTIGSCAAQVCNPDINAQGNNRFSSSQGYSYDANGNVTQDATSQRFHYDGENHQKSFFSSSNPGGTPDWTYTYDGDGRRVKKASATEQTVFVYDAGGMLVAEYSSALAPIQQVSYLTSDHLGSPRITTNQLGAVTNRKDFMAYGDEALSAQRVPGPNGNKYEPSSPTRKDYTGYEKDMESGLEFAQARYYSSTHGRFTSVDPLTTSATIRDPQTFNRYSYVLNSPYKFVDPSGLLSENTLACGSRCPNSGPWVDGSAFNSYDSGHRNGWEVAEAQRLAAETLEAIENDLPAWCASGHMCFGEQAEVSRQMDAGRSRSEIWLARAFGDPGAYFSNPNDGDPVDQTTGTPRNPATSRTDPENHMYGSATELEARTAFYIPEGGLFVGTGNYTETEGGKRIYALIQFTRLGRLRNVTVAAFHLVNINLGPRQSDRRRKLGEMGSGNGGEIGFKPIRDSRGNFVRARMSFHFHLEIFRGLRRTLPGKPKPHFNFNGVTN